MLRPAVPQLVCRLIAFLSGEAFLFCSQIVNSQIGSLSIRALYLTDLPHTALSVCLSDCLSVCLCISHCHEDFPWINFLKLLSYLTFNLQMLFILGVVAPINVWTVHLFVYSFWARTGGYFSIFCRLCTETTYNMGICVGSVTNVTLLMTCVFVTFSDTIFMSVYKHIPTLRRRVLCPFMRILGAYKWALSVSQGLIKHKQHIKAVRGCVRQDRSEQRVFTAIKVNSGQPLGIALLLRHVAAALSSQFYGLWPSVSNL